MDSSIKKCGSCRQTLDLTNFPESTRKPGTLLSTCKRCVEVASLRSQLKSTALSDHATEDIQNRLQHLNLKSGPPKTPGTWIKCGCRSYRNLDAQDATAMQRYAKFEVNSKYCFCMEQHASGAKTDAKRMKQKVATNRERRNQVQVAIAAGSLPREITKQDVPHRYCSGCTRHVPTDQFSSDQHRVCTRCAELTRDYDQNRRDLDKKRELFREKRYDIAYRASKRENDPEGYKKHNAAIQNAWRTANRDHVLQWRHKNWRGYMNGMRGQAAVKGVAWDLTDDAAHDLMHQPCFFCGTLHEKGFGGIDRLNFREGYVEDNVVSCCKECNFMKGCLDPITFVARCSRIAANNPVAGEDPIVVIDADDAVFVDMGTMSFESYASRARNLDLAFTVSRELFLDLTGGHTLCQYCKTAVARGLDRVDSNGGYTADNVVASCSQCNYSKGRLPLATFLQQCTRVAVFFTRHVDVKHVPFQPLHICKRLIKTGPTEHP